MHNKCASGLGVVSLVILIITSTSVWGRVQKCFFRIFFININGIWLFFTPIIWKIIFNELNFSFLVIKKISVNYINKLLTLMYNKYTRGLKVVTALIIKFFNEVQKHVNFCLNPSVTYIFSVFFMSFNLIW